MTKTAKSRIKFSLQPKSVWEAQNPVLAEGAIGFELSDDGSAVYGKVGNGETAYSDLPYISCPSAAETISGSGSISYSQLTKRNVTAGTAVDITLPYSAAFNYPPLEMLKFEAGTSNVIVTACSFNNGDAADFNYDSDYVYFDGYMQLKTTYNVNMGTSTTIDSSYLWLSDSLNFANFKNVEAVNVGSSGTVQIKMTATGGGKGTWALTVVPGSSSLIVASDNKVYTFGGTKLSDDWTALSNSQKAALFSSATDDNPITFLSTLGAFKFAVLTNNSTAPTCVITAVPKNQVITPDGLISLTAYEQINTVTVTSNTSGSSNVRLLVTPDLTHYYTYSNSEWQEVAISDTTTVLSSGMTTAQIASIAAETWAELVGDTVGFAYALSMTSSSETCNVDEITLTVDMKGTWKKAIHNTDYTYGYTSNTNLRVNLLTAGSYKINYSN